MKKQILFFALLSLVFVSCKKYKNKEVYANVPVYMDYETFRDSYFYEPGAFPINGTGNIFLHDQYIFLSDAYKGIHVIDNSDPANPLQVGFFNIPGNTQMAVKDNFLYVDSYIDLITIDISNMNDPHLICRYEDVLSYDYPPINDTYPVADIYKDQGVVVNWKIEKTKEVSGFMNKFFVADCEDCEQQEEQTNKIATMSSVNIAGSQSQFAVLNDNLYILDKTDILTFDVTGGSCPSYSSKVKTWREPETLFQDGSDLFVGTTTGMMIYSLDNPDQPEELGEIEHVESCDPVVVKGDYAFVTLRSTSDCGGDVNELQVIDISNRSWPKLKETFELTEPYGLGIETDFLFVCDGDDGLKVFNAHNPENAGNNLWAHFPDVKARDVICYNNMAIVIAEHSITQYDYTNPYNIVMISSIDF